MKKLLLFGVSAVLLAACGDTVSEESVSSETIELEVVSTSESVVEDITSEDSTDESIESEADKKDGEVGFDGTVAEIDDVKVVITDYKIIQPGEIGNEYGEVPVIAFWYDATNKSDKDINAMIAWLVIFSAIQDNDPNMVNELNVGSLPDDAHLDSQSKTIKKDGTVSNSVAYELSDSETPVTLIATKEFSGEEIGRYDYRVQ